MKKFDICHHFPAGKWQKIIFVMKINLVLMLCCVGQLSATASFSQQQGIDVNYEKNTIISVLEDLRAKTGYTFVHRMGVIPENATVSVSLSDATLEQVLEKVLKDKGFSYSIEGKIVVITGAAQPPVRQKSRLLQGSVHDDAGRPVIGATVKIKGTHRATATDVNGNFRITLEPGENALEVSYIGKETQEVDVTNMPGPVEVVLAESTTDVGEVVVTGVFDKPKESFTGAVTFITRDELKQNYSRNLLRTLANLDPSFRIVDNNESGSNPNVLPEIQLRGASSFVPTGDLKEYNAGGLKSEVQMTINTPLFILDGFEVSLERVTDMNDDEIESITILKDASATSLYGSRGANGVVVITSLRPKIGKMTVSYRGQVKLEVPDLTSYNMMDAWEKLDIENVYGVWENSQEEYQQIVSRLESGRVFDWMEAPVRTGIGQSHNLNLMGGDQKWRYRMDMQYMDTKGAMKGSDRRNFNGTMQLDYAGKGVGVSQSVSVGLNDSHESPYGYFAQYVQINPYWYPFDDEGNPVDGFIHPWSSSTSNMTPNPIFDALTGSWSKSKYTSIRSNTSVRIELAPGLRLNTSLGLSKQMSSGESFMSPQHSNFKAAATDQKGSYSSSNRTRTDWQVRLNLNYNKTFNEKHMLTAGVNGELSENRDNNAYWVARGFLSNTMDHPGLALSYPTNSKPSGEETISRRVSLIGSVNYYYNMRYFLDFTISTDGTSSFGDDSRFGSFYAIGAGWNMANENFIKNLGFINTFQMRYSYGVSGVMGFSPSDAMEVYQLNQSTATYMGQLGYHLMSFGNSDLQWQSTYQHNVGVDLGLFDNRIQFQFSYYNKLTDNTVTDIMLPISHGFETMKGNMGKIRNEGYEFSLAGDIVRNDDGLRLGVRGTFSHNRNTIVKLSDAFKESQSIKGMFTSLTGSADYYRYQEGKSLDAIYGLRTLGIDPNTGQRIFLTKDGRPTMIQSSSDLVYLGNRQPILNGNVSLNLYYKGLMVNVGFGVQWGKAENGTELYKAENGSLTANIDRRFVKHTWRQPGDRARYKVKSDLHNYTYICDMFVQRNNIFQCSNINISYSFPKKAVQKLGLESLTIGTDLSDIFYLSTIRRERGTDYPFSRNPNFSISFTF